MDDIALGYKVLTAFLSYFNSKYGYTFTPDQVATALSSKTPQTFIEGLGMQYRLVLNTDYSKMVFAMQKLSNASEGRIPKFQTFVSAFSQAGQSYSFFEAAQFVTIESTKEILSGVQAVGNTLIATANLLRILFPVAVVAVIYIYGKDKLKTLKVIK